MLFLNLKNQPNLLKVRKLLKKNEKWMVQNILRVLKLSSDPEERKLIYYNFLQFIGNYEEHYIEDLLKNNPNFNYEQDIQDYLNCL